MNKFSTLLAMLIISAAFVAASAQTKIIAHRGASSVAPENTLAAFQKAADLRADYFELDVYLSKDDSLVIIHDKSVNRTTDGSGFVTLLTFEQLRSFDAGSWFAPEFAGEKIPTLKEALILAKQNNIKVCIEIKGSKAGIVEKIVDLVQKLDMREQVVVFSFTLSQITRVKEIDPGIPVLFLVENLIPENVDGAASINALAVGVANDITPETLDYCRQNNLEVWIWTINSAAQMAEFIARGIDGIITNYPQLLRAIMEDDTPPTDVTLEQAIVAGTSVTLKWTPANDPDSEISGYEIYRDTVAEATTLYHTTGAVTEFVDETGIETRTFYYRIKARNYAGLTSAHFSNELSVTTETDVVPPEIIDVLSYGSATTVFVQFNERVNPDMAVDIASYELDNTQIIAADLSLDEKTVILTTSALSEATPYTLTIKQMRDQAASPNEAHNLVATFQHYDFPSGLVAAWPMDEGEGDVIADVSGNNNTGDLANGVLWNSGHLANGLYFDGKDDYVQLGSSPSLDINGEAVTLSVWVKLKVRPGDLPSAYGPIYDSDQDSYVLYEDRGNKELRFKVTTSSGAERPGIKEEDLPLEEWLHIVGVYDGSRARIYMNGELMDEHTGLSGTVKTGQSARLGENQNSYFKGGIDDVQVYAQALSEKEINELYLGKETSAGIADHKVAADFALLHNYPNPFNPRTTIQYRIAAAGMVELAIFNSLGQKVRTLIDEAKPAGRHQAVWDGSDSSGRKVASGVYFYRLRVGELVEHRSMLLTH